MLTARRTLVVGLSVLASACTNGGECVSGPFTAGKLQGNWRQDSVTYGESHVRENMVFSACGVEFFSESAGQRSESQFLSFAVAGRRLWVGNEKGQTRFSNEFAVSTRTRILAMNPYWPVGPHSGVVGTWVQTPQPASEPASKLTIDTDGGALMSAGSDDGGTPVFAIGIDGDDGGIEAVSIKPIDNYLDGYVPPSDLWYRAP